MKPKKRPNRKFFDRPLEIALHEAVRWMFLPFLRGGEMDILPFYEATRWMLRGGEMDGRHAVPASGHHLLVDKLLKLVKA